MFSHVRGIEKRPIVDNDVDRKDFVCRMERTITWNADNMPTTVIRQAGGSSVTTHFDYDGQGRRAIKSTGGNTTYYISREFELINGASTMYIYAGDLRVAKVSGGAIYYFHKDHLGSSTMMTDKYGTVVEGTEYMPFGSQREHLGTDVSAYKFTDQELYATTGFYNYNARLYDPVIGRFISADTIVPDPFDPQLLNRYSYVRNNPLIYVDPSGHHLGGYNGPDHNTDQAFGGHDSSNPDGDPGNGQDFSDNGSHMNDSSADSSDTNNEPKSILGELLAALGFKIKNIPPPQKPPKVKPQKFLHKMKPNPIMDALPKGYKPKGINNVGKLVEFSEKSSKFGRIGAALTNALGAIQNALGIGAGATVAPVGFQGYNQMLNDFNMKHGGNLGQNNLPEA